MPPLNSSPTPPLTEHGLRVLDLLAQESVPAQMLNPGVVNRLVRENLAELYLAPNPYRTRRGDISWLRITPSGRTRLTGW